MWILNSLLWYIQSLLLQVVIHQNACFMAVAVFGSGNWLTDALFVDKDVLILLTTLNTVHCQQLKLELTRVAW